MLGDPIMKLVYPSDNGLAGVLLLIGSGAVMFYSLSTITNAVLQGIGRMSVPVINATISLIVHVILLVILLYGFNLGIYAVVIANMVFALLMCIMNAVMIKKVLNYSQEIWYTFVIPLFAGAVMGGVAYGAYKLIYRIYPSNAAAALIAIVLAVIVYGVILLLTRCISENDLKAMPMGTTVVRILKKLHLV